jgi:hypothetical protein
MGFPLERKIGRLARAAFRDGVCCRKGGISSVLSKCQNPLSEFRVDTDVNVNLFAPAWLGSYCLERGSPLISFTS